MKPVRPLGLRLIEAAVVAQWVLAGGLLEIALRRVRFPLLIAWVRAAAAGRGAWFPLGRRVIPLPRTLRLAAAAVRVWRGDNACLPRSVMTLWLLLGERQSAILVLGVRRNPVEPFRAHAWVEVASAPVIEEAGAGFTPLAHY